MSGGSSTITTSSVMSAMNASTTAPVNGVLRSQRTHRLSMSSTGSSSSPPSSAGTTPCTPSGHFMPQTKKNKFEFFADAEQAAAGNIFRHRTDLAAFGALPRHLQVSVCRGWWWWMLLLLTLKLLSEAVSWPRFSLVCRQLDEMEYCHSPHG